MQTRSERERIAHEEYRMRSMQRAYVTRFTGITESDENDQITGTLNTQQRQFRDYHVN